MGMEKSGCPVMFTTRSYLEIFVTKLRGDRSSEMGMRTRRISTLEYTFWS